MIKCNIGPRFWLPLTFVSTIVTNESHLSVVLCVLIMNQSIQVLGGSDPQGGVCSYQFLVLYDKSSSHINYIFKCSIFSLSVQSAVIFTHRSRLRLKTFKLQQTEVACLIVLKTKLNVNHPSFGSHTANRVIN